MTEVTRCFCLHQNLVPKGLSVPAMGLHTCIKSRKNVYKISLQQRDFLKLVANDCVTRGFFRHQNFGCNGLSIPAGATYMYKIMKEMCIKTRAKNKIFLFPLTSPTLKK